MTTLTEIYKTHSGKVSDKWAIFLAEYDEKFILYKDENIRLLEIGIQNGGSLEIYSKYFKNAELILGCDINLKCKNLSYEESNIQIVVGDATQNEVFKQITENQKFDIIIDDGSHTSSDIIKTFCLYFNQLNDGGIFIIEDLHCSYWQRFSGGLFHPLSSINFFKRLVDVLNFEHWGIARSRDWLLRIFSLNYNLNLNRLALQNIHSVEFVNSMCFIRKKIPLQNELGKRIVVGCDAFIVPIIKTLNNTTSDLQSENSNYWSNRDLPPEEELIKCNREITALKNEIAALKNLTNNS